MQPYSYRRQVQTVLVLELAILLFLAIGLFIFWGSFCGGSLSGCFNQSDASAPAKFLLLSFFRPFLLTPESFFIVLSINTFGPYLGIALSLVGNTISCLSVFLTAKFIGTKIIKPWLLTNLPQTYRFIHSQDYKVALLCRLIPIFHFDFFSILFAVADFRLKSVLLATVLGTIPEAFVIAQIVSKDPALGSFKSLILVIAVIAVVIAVYEYKSRKSGFSLWQRFQAMFYELQFEVARNNDVIKRYQYDNKKIPVLLVYGFFSSRRALTVLEKLLISRGYDVISFNLGGLLGVFFTKGILETANFIDYKLKRQFSRYNFDKIHIVAHSKGGLVALWWLLKLGGSKHCEKLICMGTPFKGSPLTYLALITPLGYLWRDVWQMRPGSGFIQSLENLEIPDSTEIYCFYSDTDKVAGGERGKYINKNNPSNVHNISLGQIGHFEFLHKRRVVDKIVSILGSPYKPSLEKEKTQSIQLSSG